MSKQLALSKPALIGFTAIALSMVAFSAQSIPMVVNGSFETTIGRNTTNYDDFPNNPFDPLNPGMLRTSANITGPTTTPLTISGWSTTRDGIGCVVFPATELTQVCGPDRFSGNKFWASPGVSPDGGNYVLIDGDTITNFPNTPSTSLYQMLTGIVAGQSYWVNFWQAAAQFTDATGATTERWDVSLGGTIFNDEGNFTDGVHKLSDLMITPSQGVHGWQYQSLRFDVPLGSPANQVLAFFSVGTPGGLPPIVLLDGVSITQVPEPETLALVGIGLLGILAARRRRKNKLDRAVFNPQPGR